MSNALLPFRLAAVGIPEEFRAQVLSCAKALAAKNIQGKALRRLFKRLGEDPQAFISHPELLHLATMLTVHVSNQSQGVTTSWHSWGENLDPAAVEQMRTGCSLPVARGGALMPDAHVGYGLPIGGVLAVENAVIPYGVGMDIACRMKMSVYAVPPDLLKRHEDDLAQALESETRFGVGAAFARPKEHPVMHEDWSFSPVTRKMKDTAWAQLGTSGSGNHFVEWGILDLHADKGPLTGGRYLALLSHSGSRGSGGEVAKYYSTLSRKEHPELSKELGHLAWLDLDSDPGREYWAAMELMGRYSAANHALIHSSIGGKLGLRAAWSVENHHNFAWIEEHAGTRLVVHRKGATPAGGGIFGVIPGTMVDPAFVVEGLGNPRSFNSAAHGAGRLMSRKEATRRCQRKDLEYTLVQNRVRLLSGGLDEAPMAYKNIHDVMAWQSDLVRVIGTFQPRIVKMSK